MSINLDFKHNVAKAVALMKKVHAKGGGLVVMTGAGMSVQSGVPVFRNSDGSMSKDFLRFLSNYNKARSAAGQSTVKDWFGFSVPEMFDATTAKEAWHYWRWRTLRALVKPGKDYEMLGKVIDYFGPDRTFVKTSNCDSLHIAAGMPEMSVQEIHGTLSKLQCSVPCCEDLLDADATFLKNLAEKPDWVPKCPKCDACLRPNVMIFGDGQLVHQRVDEQKDRFWAFIQRFYDGKTSKANVVVLEIGAGVVVCSIRSAAESVSSHSSHGGLIRVNPSAEECRTFTNTWGRPGTYCPLVARSEEACAAIAEGLTADVKISASASTGASVSASDGVGASVSASDGASAVGVSASDGVGASASASGGGGVSASASASDGVGTSASASDGVGASASAVGVSTSDGASVSASTSTSVSAGDTSDLAPQLPSPKD